MGAAATGASSRRAWRRRGRGAALGLLVRGNAPVHLDFTVPVGHPGAASRQDRAGGRGRRVGRTTRRAASSARRRSGFAARPVDAADSRMWSSRTSRRSAFRRCARARQGATHSRGARLGINSSGEVGTRVLACIHSSGAPPSRVAPSVRDAPVVHTFKYRWRSLARARAARGVP